MRQRIEKVLTGSMIADARLKLNEKAEEAAPEPDPYNAQIEQLIGSRNSAHLGENFGIEAGDEG